MGVRPPPWDFARLASSSAAFDLLVQIHYRYYKFYANMVVAMLVAIPSVDFRLSWRAVGYLLLALLFFLGSRDALSKYYARAGQLLQGQTIRGVEL